MSYAKCKFGFKLIRANAPPAAAWRVLIIFHGVVFNIDYNVWPVKPCTILIFT
jgi:hypothetical protein